MTQVAAGQDVASGGGEADGMTSSGDLVEGLGAMRVSS